MEASKDTLEEEVATEKGIFGEGGGGGVRWVG